MIRRWGVTAVLGNEPVPMRLLTTLGALESAYNVVRKLATSHGEDIHRMTADEMELIAWYRSEGWLD